MRLYSPEQYKAAALLSPLSADDLSELLATVQVTVGYAVTAKAENDPPPPPPPPGPGKRVATPKPKAEKPAKKAAAAEKQENGKRHRSSAEEVQRQKDLVLATIRMLGVKVEGWAKSDISDRAAADFDIGRALSLLVDDDKLVREGERRAARYWVKVPG
jgi:hypothetical protein